MKEATAPLSRRTALELALPQPASAKLTVHTQQTQQTIPIPAYSRKWFTQWSMQVKYVCDVWGYSDAFKLDCNKQFDQDAGNITNFVSHSLSFLNGA